jgi:hypothetical protein
MRFIFALVIGVGAGYFIGWNDAKTHDKHIVERLVQRAGGATRDRLKTDVDSTMNATQDGATKH